MREQFGLSRKSSGKSHPSVSLIRRFRHRQSLHPTERGFQAVTKLIADVIVGLP